MHPIERLRYVARAGGFDLAELVQDAADALAGFADDPAALVTACRSLVDRHPAAGPLWWLASRVLTSSEPHREAWRAAEEVEGDETYRTLLREVPEGARVLAVGWTSSIDAALRRRGDCHLLVVDPGGQAGFALDRLARSGVQIDEVADAGLGAAAAACDLVVVEAQAMGPTGFVAVAGARAAAAVACAAGTPVWVSAPFGRLLPSGTWDALAGRLAESAAPWHEPDEVVPLALATMVARPGGLLEPAAAVASPDCAFAPELLRPLDAPGSYGRR